MASMAYLCNLFYIYNIFGIIRIRAYNLCTPCYLQEDKEKVISELACVKLKPKRFCARLSCMVGRNSNL